MLVNHFSCSKLTGNLNGTPRNGLKSHNMALLVGSKTCLAFMSDTCWRVRMHGDRAKLGSPDEARAFHPETCLPLQLAKHPIIFANTGLQ